MTATGTGHAIDDLMEVEAKQDVAALLHGGTLGGCADHDARRLGPSRLDRLTDRDTRSRAHHTERAIQRVLEGDARPRLAGVDRPERRAGAGVLAEHHLGMVEEIAVDRQCGLAVLGRDRLGHVEPSRAHGCLAGAALLQKQDVDDDFGAGCGLHGGLRQADGADQVGHLGDMRASMAGRLVHAPPRGHERGDAARLQSLDGAGDEVVMQAQSQLAARVGRPHRPVGKGRVADGQVEGFGDAGLGEVLAADPGIGEQSGRRCAP